MKEDNKTWWTKKNYKKYLKVLRNKGAFGLEQLNISPIVPEVDRAFKYDLIVVDYVAGIGFVFVYDMHEEIEGINYHVRYERTFYYNKIEDKTKVSSEELGHHRRFPGFVSFPKDEDGHYKVRGWIKSVLGGF